MKKKRLFKSLVLLFGSSLVLGIFLSLKLADVKDKSIAVYAYEGTKLPTNGGSLASGTYYIDTNMTLNNYITVSTGSSVIINLNGCTLNARTKTGEEDDQPVIYVNGGTVTINGKDNVTGNRGTLTNGTGYRIGGYTRGGAVAVYGGEAIINDCNLIDNNCCFGGAVFISTGNTVTLNNCNIYDNDTYGGYGIVGAVYAEGAGATVNINGGEIYNNDAGVRLYSEASTPAKGYLNGVYIHDNKRYGACVDGGGSGGPALNISGDTIIENNSTSVTSGARPNLRLNGANQAKVAFTSPLGENASIGVNLTNNTGVFTSGWSTVMGDADPSDYFFSDTTDVIIGKNPSGELLFDVPRTVTYITERGTAPDPDTVANGSIIYNEPTSPSEEGYEFKGWYKDSGFENAWDFETDTVTANTTLYAKWDYIDPAVANVIRLINDIDPVTYDGGTNDSKADIEAARNAYDALDDDLKQHVSNYQTLVDDETIYSHVDDVAILIEAIPEASDTQEYYDAVDAAKAAYDLLTPEEQSILGDAPNFDYVKKLNDNVAAKDVIEKIQDIGSLTYDGGQNDSLADIVAAETAYNALTDDQKAIVNGVNHTTLVDDRTIYDHVDEVATLIEDIPEASESEEYYNAVDAAKAAFDALTDAEKAIIRAATDVNYEKVLEDNVAARNVIEKIQDIGSLTYDGGTSDSKAAILAAETAYNTLTDDQKVLVNSVNYDVLVHDRTVYDHVDYVAGLINAIPAASESDEYYNAVDAAKAAYDLLTLEEQTILGNAPNFNYVKKLNDNVAAKDVIEKIQDIGSLTYDGGTSDSKAAIEAAENAYNALTDDQKAIVNGVNKDTLEHDRLVYDHVDYVGDLIDAIPEASESDEYYNAVDTAKAAYDNLTGVEKALLGNAPNFDYVKKLNDNVAAKKVIKLIDDINEVTYNGGKDDSLADIINAEKEYYKLTDDQKAIVNGVNKDTLDHDILVYDHVDNVGDLIKEIPEASNTDDYYNAVDAAKAAYDLLTPEEKAILGDAIDFSYEKVLEDNVKAEEVIKLIDEIGDVTYNGGSNDSLEDIENAEEAYNALSADQKSLVELANLDTLEEDRETYDAVDETVKLIESIGDVSHGGENDSKEAIDAAKAAYDSLTPEQQELVASYNDSEKVLEDDEAVYGAMEAIDSIGDVSYTTESEEAINHAQEVYDSLTEDQKEQLGDDYKNKIVESKNKFELAKKQGDILFLILIIVVCSTLVGGIVFLCFLINKKRKDDDNDGKNSNGENKPVKAMSVGGLLPGVILISHYFDTKYIILYVLAFLAIVVWIACLIVALTIKRKKAIKEEVKPQQVEEAKPQENNQEEEEVETVTDEKGNIFQIRYIKSFTAKLIQSPEETKKYYEELKNEVLSYKNTHSRISWHFDSVNSGRNYVLRFAVRGKTLCVYFPLNADDYVDSKYKVEKAESKRYEDVPCLYRIKNDRRLGYAKELIAVVANNLGLEKGEEQHEVYSNLPYEPNKPLVARGLIKEQKIQVNKPATAPVVLETKTNSDGDEVVVTKDASGNIFEIRYIKSFTAKLSQSEDVTKDYYTVLKNYVLSYKGTHSRVSWHYDAINVGRDYVLKFTIRGKTLCVYYALDASKVGEKYKVEEAKGRKFEDVPVLYRIKNDRRCEYAKELIDLLMSEKGLTKGEEQNEDYRIPTESTKALLAKGLIKEVKSKVQDKKIIEHYESISVSKADEVMSDDKAEASVEEVEVNKHKEGSKEIINIDTLSEHYNNGDEVTLDSLIEKKLVPSKCGHVKVLARGELNKKLHVVANEYSLQAIKMIVLMGGSVKKVK